MARNPLPPGTAGPVRYAKERGRWVARRVYRDYAGNRHRLERWGSTKTQAGGRLDEALAEFTGTRAETTPLRPGDTFNRAADMWEAMLAERLADGEITATTADRYQGRLKVLRSALGALQLRECTAGRLEMIVRDLYRGRAQETRKGLRHVLQDVFSLAVRHNAIPANPARELPKIRGGATRKPPRALTPEERRRLLDYVDADPRCRRNDLPDLIRFMLGTGMRISEALAVRWCDVDLDGTPVVVGDEMRMVPVVTVAGNLACVRGVGLVRHQGKTAQALRVIPLPSMVVDLLRARHHPGLRPEWPVFATSGPSGEVVYRWPQSVRRVVRDAREAVGLGWMTPHNWRDTYATILDDERGMTDRAKADLLGHAKFLKDAYVSRGELHPDAAVVLDQALR